MLDLPSSIKHYGTPLGIGVHHGTIPEMRNQRLVPSVTGELGLIWITQRYMNVHLLDRSVGQLELLVGHIERPFLAQSLASKLFEVMERPEIDKAVAVYQGHD